MVDADILGRRLLSLSEALQHLEKYAPTLSAEQLATDALLQAAIERWLQIAVEACIDAAYYVVAERGWTPPDSARNAFAVLGAHDVISSALATRLGRAAGMRNVLVHDYAAVDRELLASAVRDDLGDFRAFGAALGGLLAHAETP